MGFHLLKKVYANVLKTTPTQQAVLAYLAFTADDANVRKCHPPIELIEKTTHLGHTAISQALKALEKAEFLKHKAGGRRPGADGRSYANEYQFFLPDKPSDHGVREADTAVSVSRTEQMPPDGECSIRQVDTISNSQESDHHRLISSTPQMPRSHMCDAEVGCEAFDEAAQKLGESYRAKYEGTKQPQPNAADLEGYRQENVSPFAAAMDICEVERDDIRTRQAFFHVLKDCDRDVAREEIRRFENEVLSGLHKNANSLAAVLLTRLTPLRCNVE